MSLNLWETSLSKAVAGMALRGNQLARSLRSAWGQQQSRALVTQSLPDLPYDYRCTLALFTRAVASTLLPMAALWPSALAFIPHFSRHCSHPSPHSSYAERSELEPVISAEIMELHHKKHHQTYINALNTAAEKFAEVKSLCFFLRASA